MPVAIYRVSGSSFKICVNICDASHGAILKTKICMMETHLQGSVAPWIHALFYFSFFLHTFLIQGDLKVMELRFSSAISPKLWQDSYFLKFKSLASGFLPLSPLLPPAWLGPEPRAKVSASLNWPRWCPESEVLLLPRDPLVSPSPLLRPPRAALGGAWRSAPLADGPCGA